MVTKQLAIAVSLVSALSVMGASGPARQPVTAPAHTTQRAIIASPYETGSKPVLSYLLSQPAYQQQVRTDLSLTNAQYDALMTVVRGEQSTLAKLYTASNAIIAQTNLTVAQRKTQVATMGYNAQVVAVTHASRASVEQRLGSPLAARFATWIDRLWIADATAHNGGQALIGPQGLVRCRVFATQYDPNTPGSRETSVPDKYVKFAALGWQYAQGYSAGGNYFTRVQGNGRALFHDSVLDVGPWNENDNYWDENSSVRPRRTFTDLNQCQPESQAAYQNGYNGGQDEFGRTVLNPAGLDMSIVTAAQLGLGSGQNTWLYARYMWE